jgi:hypothetical protein
MDTRAALARERIMHIVQNPRSFSDQTWMDLETRLVALRNNHLVDRLMALDEGDLNRMTQLIQREIDLAKARKHMDNTIHALTTQLENAQ